MNLLELMYLTKEAQEMDTNKTKQLLEGVEQSWSQYGQGAQSAPQSLRTTALKPMPKPKLPMQS